MRSRLMVLAVAWTVLTARGVPGQVPDPLEAVAFLAGGTWVGEGRWPDGSALCVEVRYHWGATRRVLHFETYDRASGARHLLYEGLIFFDGRRGKIFQWNMKPTGELTESDLTRVDSAGYEVRGVATWSLIRRLGADAFRWQLRVPDGDGWKTILEASYRREPESQTVADSLIAFERRSWQAWKERDGAFFQEFLSDDHVELGVHGRSSKEEVVASVASPRCVVHSYTTDRFEFARLDSNTALLTYYAEQNTTCDGKPLPSPAWASSLYARRNGRWVNVLYQQTPSRATTGGAP